MNIDTFARETGRTVVKSSLGEAIDMAPYSFEEAWRIAAENGMRLVKASKKHGAHTFTIIGTAYDPYDLCDFVDIADLIITSKADLDNEVANLLEALEDDIEDDAERENAIAELLASKQRLLAQMTKGKVAIISDGGSFDSAAVAEAQSMSYDIDSTYYTILMVCEKV